MASGASRTLDRRRVLTAIGAGSAIALAGCVGGDEAADDEARADDEDDAMDGEEAEDELLSVEPAPEGEPLSEDDIQALVAAFDDEPMNEDQLEVEGEERSYTPSHVWKWVSDETLIGLHFNDPNPEEADALNWIVVGQKGWKPDQFRVAGKMSTDIAAQAEAEAEAPTRPHHHRQSGGGGGGGQQQAGGGGGGNGGGRRRRRRGGRGRERAPANA